MLMIEKAEYLRDYKVRVVFNDGRRAEFDFEPLIRTYPAFSALSDVDLFKDFTLTDTLEWNGGQIDIAPEYLYDHAAFVHE